MKQKSSLILHRSQHMSCLFAVYFGLSRTSNLASGGGLLRLPLLIASPNPLRFSAFPSFFTNFHANKRKTKLIAPITHRLPTSSVCTFLPSSFTDFYANKRKINIITTPVARRVRLSGVFMLPCYRNWSGTGPGPDWTTRSKPV